MYFGRPIVSWSVVEDKLFSRPESKSGVVLRILPRGFLGGSYFSPEPTQNLVQSFILSVFSLGAFVYLNVFSMSSASDLLFL